jgi:hypothetical protein
LRIEGFFKNASAVFRAVAIAQPPERSFVSRPHVGICDVDLLPSSLLQGLGARECFDNEWTPLIASRPTIGDFLRRGEAAIVAVGSSYIRVRPTDSLRTHFTDFICLETSIAEILRADLDGDGLEDILVAIHGRAVRGSHGHSTDPVVLSRRSTGGIFERSELND